MSRLRQLISEVHRRSLWQVLAAYLVGAAVGYQLIEALTDGLGLPDWFPALAVILFIVGLPIVLATAFVQEGAPLVSRRDPTLLPATEAITAEPESVQGTKRLFTWRNAILGGVLAFALLGIVTAGYMTMRLMGIGAVGTLVAKGIVEERERIVLADFEDHSGYSLLALTATEALRIDLSQSPVVRIAEPGFLSQALRRMRLDPDVRITEQVAREIATREGLPAILVGEINRAGTAFLFSAQLLSAEGDQVLLNVRESADDSASILHAIDRLSKKVRGRFGESLKTIRRSRPLSAVTTSSLEALRKHTQGVRAAFAEGDYDRAIKLLEEAIALDTTFASAHLYLGVALWNTGRTRSRMIELLARALEHADRLPDRERYMIQGLYHQLVTDEAEKAIPAYRSLLDTWPDDLNALNALGLFYYRIGDLDQAEELLLRLMEVDSSCGPCTNNLIAVQVASGKFEKATSTLEGLPEYLSSNPEVQLRHALLASVRGDYDSAERHLKSIRETQGQSGGWRAGTSRQLATVAKVRGQLVAADGYLRDAMTANESLELAGNYIGDALELVYLDFQIRNEPTRSLEPIETALDRFPLDSLDPLDRPYLFLATVYALAGNPDRAKAYLAEHEQAVGSQWGHDQPWRHRALGHVALAEGEPQRAIVEWRQWDRDAPRWFGAAPLGELAWAYDLASQADSAIAIYERYVEIPWVWRIYWDGLYLHRTYERLGRLYEERGNTEKAAYYYGKFVDLWKDADPELQPRVEAARRAIAALSPDQ